MRHTGCYTDSIDRTLTQRLTKLKDVINQRQPTTSTTFNDIIHDLFINGQEDFPRYSYQQFCACSPKTVCATHSTFPTLFNGTGVFFFGGREPLLATLLSFTYFFVTRSFGFFLYILFSCMFSVFRHQSLFTFLCLFHCI